VHNVKLARVAEQIAHDFRELSHATIPSHAPFDRMLFAASERVGGATED
jgi:hypothetical protein